MKAIVYTKYGSPDVLRLKEIGKPVPRSNEVLIKIRATTVTAVDSIFRRGNNFFARTATGISRPKVKILGTEFAGDIESIGTGVKLFKIGDKVFGDSPVSGTHAEYISLPESGPLALIPANMDYDEASAVPYGALTALPFLRDSGRIKNGQKVLIIGASGAVGSFAVQLAKYYGAEVTGLSSSSNVELVKSLGADMIIDYKKEDFTQNGETYDIIFDTVGKSSFSRCKKLLKPSGKYLTTVIGIPILFQMLMTSKIGNKKAVITFTGLRNSSEKAKDLLFIKKLIESGKLKTVIDKRYPFEKIAEAHRYVDEGHKKGNVVISLDD